MEAPQHNAQAHQQNRSISSTPCRERTQGAANPEPNARLRRIRQPCLRARKRSGAPLASQSDGQVVRDLAPQIDCHPSGQSHAKSQWPAPNGRGQSLRANTHPITPITQGNNTKTKDGPSMKDLEPAFNR